VAKVFDVNCSDHNSADAGAARVALIAAVLIPR
jgi:hypothetical protein